MEAGAVLFVIALIGLLMGGGVGPCGPGTAAGWIGFLSFGAAWIVSIASLLLKLRHSKSRSMLGLPVLVATALTAGLAGLFMRRAGGAWAWTDAGSVLLYIWPPTVATVHAVRDRVQQA